LTLDAAEKMVNACESLAKTKGWKAVTPRMPGGKRGSAAALISTRRAFGHDLP